MTRLVSACSTDDGSRRLKCLGLSLTFLFVCTIVINVQPSRARAGMDMSAIPSGDSEPMPPLPVRMVPPASAAADKPVSALSEELRTSSLALQLHVTQLELAVYKLRALGSYSCTFTKQEAIDDGELSDEHVIDLKIRHEPFSIYMKWEEGGDEGREILYVNSSPDAKMLVKLGGVKGKLLPHLKLDPQGDLARSESRHPITDVGLLNLTEKILAFRTRDLAHLDQVRWEMHSGDQFGDRPCYLFTIEYKSKEYESTYRKSLVWIDRDLGLPVCVQNFCWPEEDSTVKGDELDEETLVEYYGYTDLDFARSLADGDFDKSNPDYTFRR